MAAGTFFLTFSGGEVCLRPDLFSILEYARSHKFAISLMTTGTHGLQKDELRFLKDLGLNGLIMSLFSLDPGVHDRITGVNGSWEQLQRTITTGKALGVPVVLTCIALSLNSGGIPEVKRFAAQEEIPLRLDGSLTPRWDGRPHPEGLALSVEAERQLHHEMALSPKENQEPLSVPWEMESQGCGAGLNRCYLTPQGEMWPCIEVPWACGRITGKKNQFHRIWSQSKIINKIRLLQEKGSSFEGRLCDIYRGGK